ncbi:MAG TPA: hypothetical protein VG298_13730 [Acidimicrobiales bacterium]|nr:hypothetical protein [Acidimicrobiales bacterium]
MSSLAHLLEALLIAGALLLIGAAVAFIGLRRYVRRRWHRVRSHVATREAMNGLSVLKAWRERLAARATPQELASGTATRARRRMWLAIEDAEAAVGHADTVDAPVAELPAVCRSLRRVGGELDRLLRLERRLPLAQGRPDPLRAQVAEVMQAARDVQMAALRAGSDATEPQLRSLVRDARDEVEIVAAALRRMRSVTPHQP